MQRSLFSAVTGLQNHQTRMDVIGNNIANVNTTAFKAGRVTFKQSFSQVLSGGSLPTDTSGGMNEIGVGLGSQLGSIDSVFTQGNFELTGINTDMAIKGSSFFVVANGNQQMYTRAGEFTPDGNGNLVSNANGYILQGKMATNGVLGGGLTNIKIPAGTTAPANATTKVTLSGNYDSTAPTITAVDPNNPTAAELADPANAGSVVRSTLSVYDSLGKQHDLTMVAWKTSNNTWDFNVDPTSLGYDTTATSSFGPGTLAFNANGGFDAANSTMPTIGFTPDAGGAPVSLTFDPGTGDSAITSYAGGTSAVLRDQDGYAAGTLEDFTIDQHGMIIGSFSNGKTQVLAQVALADFNNPEGLSNIGDNMFTVSPNSGTPVIGFSGVDTSSTIAGKYLEMSNVDLAQEFTNMIVTQRGFQANGKMITTSDEMLQDLVNLKR